MGRCCYDLNLGLRAPVYGGGDNAEARHNMSPRRMMMVNGRDQVNARLCEVASRLGGVQQFASNTIQRVLTRTKIISLVAMESST